MEYTFEKITTVEGYQALLATAHEKKQKLERSKRNLGEAIDTFRNRLEKFSQESADVQQTLAALTTAYHALPEGKHKLTMNIRIKRLEYRQAWLQLKALTYNTAALLAREVKYNKLEAQISVIARYIESVEQSIAKWDDFDLRDMSPAAMLKLPISRYPTTLLPKWSLRAYDRAVKRDALSIFANISRSTLKAIPALFPLPEDLN